MARRLSCAALRVRVSVMATPFITLTCEEHRYVIHSLKLAYNSGDQRNRGGPVVRAPRIGLKLLSRDTLNSLLNRD
jgi:hypothetical protein